MSFPSPGEGSAGSSDGKLRSYNLRKYQRSNQSTCIDQRPAVTKGQHIRKGEILANSSSTVNGNLALGQNVTGSLCFLGRRQL